MRCQMLSIIGALNLESLSLIYANMNVITDRLQQYYAFLKGYLTLHCNNDYDIANLTFGFWILPKQSQQRPYGNFQSITYLSSFVYA